MSDIILMTQLQAKLKASLGVPSNGKFETAVASVMSTYIAAQIQPILVVLGQLQAGLAKAQSDALAAKAAAASAMAQAAAANAAAAVANARAAAAAALPRLPTTPTIPIVSVKPVVPAPTPELITPTVTSPTPVSPNNPVQQIVEAAKNSGVQVVDLGGAAVNPSPFRPVVPKK